VSVRELRDGGLAVSRTGLGGNNFGPVVDLAGTRAIVDAAIDAGVTFIDTAERYGDGDSERFLGEALRGRRDRVVLATKFGGGPPGERARGTAAYIRRAIEGSLTRLQTDYVDLLYRAPGPPPPPAPRPRLASRRFRTSTRCSNGTPTRTCFRSAVSSASASSPTSRSQAAC
jgi:aryl-alcohol dehydrogenase-like predicted oxidoreductase